MCLILHPFQSIFKLVTLGSLLRHIITKTLDWAFHSSCSYQTGVNHQLPLPYLITRMCSGYLITTTLLQHHHNTKQTLHIQCTITTHPLFNHTHSLHCTIIITTTIYFDVRCLMNIFRPWKYSILAIYMCNVQYNILMNGVLECNILKGGYIKCNISKGGTNWKQKLGA